jgi:RNA polymerase sigma-70 factor (ECF subfamily)
MMSRTHEDRLIRRAQRGDGAAIEELIREHQDALYAFMLRLSGRPDVAEDMVQEAFVRVIKNIDRFDTRFRFSTWTFTIARRLYVNHIQKHRPVSDSEGMESWASESDRPEDLMAAEEKRDHLRRILDVAVSCLTPLQREIVTLFHHQSWSIEALSSHLALPEGTIKSHLHRARKRMHAAISSDESLARKAEEVME